MRTLVILTGGTFGSYIREDRLSAEEPLSQCNDLLGIAASHFSNGIEMTFRQPFSKLSENINPDDWENIFSALAEEMDKYDNALVIHGTDTMAYSSAALSYLNALKLNTTIVFTGANIPLSSVNSDAQVNFLQALATLKFLQQKDIKGTFIVFNGTNKLDGIGHIHVGTRVKKDKWDGDCYRSFYIGKQSIGEVSGTQVSTFDEIQYSKLCGTKSELKLSTSNFSSKSVAAFKTYPGLHPNSLPLPRNGPKYFLLELYNSGTAPADNSEYSFVPWIRQVVNEGGAVFAISQHEGKKGVSMNIYESSAALLKAGIVPLSDLIWEAALPKLMLAASNFSSTLEVVEFMQANAAAEISK